jgi:LmbE family N-acetylglucosaminyl deacetylase
MNWIYLSPHLDDAVLSCGALIREQTNAGEQVSIWTLCAGEPPPGPLSPFAQSLHQRWQVGREAIAERRKEDIRACKLLGSEYRHFQIPDCIYRKDPQNGEYLYTSETALFGPLQPAEADLLSSVYETLAQSLPPQCELVCPLTLGGHVDHRLTRQAAERLNRTMHYYADFPYVLDHQAVLEELQRQAWESKLFPISTSGQRAWEQAVAAYQSQISTFWSDIPEMQAALRAYAHRETGVRLWKHFAPYENA